MDFDAPKLTRRQEQVLKLLSQGLANKEIATELGMSQSTVRVHVSAILRALDVDNRTAAVVAANATGIIR